VFFVEDDEGWWRLDEYEDDEKDE